MQDNVYQKEFDGIATKLITPIRIVNPINHREVVVPAIWDTGATYSVIRDKVSEFLKLETAGYSQSFLGIKGKYTCRAVVSVAMPGDQNHAVIVDVMEHDIPLADIDFIIGMDIITKGNLLIAHQDGKTVLSFEFNEEFVHIEKKDGVVYPENKNRDSFHQE